MDKFKVPEDILSNRNGRVLSIKEDNASIGMHEQMNNPFVPFSTGEKMKRGAESEMFDNNGGDSKADGAGVINKNGEYGPITYGF